jgi:hypothetical protein
MRRSAIGFRFLLLAALAISLAGVAFAAQGGGSAKVILCAAKHGGQVTLASKGKCDKDEKKLAIAKQGPPGETGAAGSDGTPADLAPEAMRLVQPFVSDCAAQPGSFCINGGGTHWLSRGNGYAPAGYQKDSGGYVHLQGVLAQGGSGAPFGGVAFYLPPGYRPTDGTHQFYGQGWFDQGTPGTAKLVEIATDGSVFVDDSCCASLDGIVFHP